MKKAVLLLKLTTAFLSPIRRKACRWWLTKLRHYEPIITHQVCHANWNRLWATSTKVTGARIDLYLHERRFGFHKLCCLWCLSCSKWLTATAPCCLISTMGSACNTKGEANNGRLSKGRPFARQVACTVASSGAWSLMRLWNMTVFIIYITFREQVLVWSFHSPSISLDLG